MDDFNISSLHESKNEWCARLLTILTPLLIEGLNSIFNEAVSLCKSNNEMDKYLMTFQNFITRIPKWNKTIIENEKARIIERSGCNYLEELITCVYIIQLKLLTAVRVGKKQKKIDINIPKLDEFIHKVYVNIARKIYKNVYLFEIGISPLNIQKNNRELELNVQECILNTVRESIPVETILRAYLDETVEEDVVEEINEEVIEKPEAKKREKEKEKEKEPPLIISEIKPTPKLETDEIIKKEQYIEPSFPELKDEYEVLIEKDPREEEKEKEKEPEKEPEKELEKEKEREQEREKELDREQERREREREKEREKEKYNDYDDDDDEKISKLIISNEDIKLDNLDVQPVNLNEDLLFGEIEILD